MVAFLGVGNGMFVGIQIISRNGPYGCCGELHSDIKTLSLPCKEDPGSRIVIYGESVAHVVMMMMMMLSQRTKGGYFRQSYDGPLRNPLDIRKKEKKKKEREFE